MKKTGLLLFVSAVVLASVLQVVAAERRVVWITIDGLRWQEVYGGADSLLVRNQDFVSDPASTHARFMRPSAQERRETLMPFVWNTVSRIGWMAGNRRAGCCMNVTNNFNLSYPGYSEALCGYADNERVVGNQPIDNPNETVLEVIDRDSRYHGQILCFAGWDCFPHILNAARSGLEVNAAQCHSLSPSPTPVERLLDTLLDETIVQFEGERDDAFTFHYALEAMRSRHPQVLYVALCDADEYAHSGHYDGYLAAAQRVDKFIGELWQAAQADPFYRDRTTFIVTCDHGRGDNPCNPREWRSHGKRYAHSDETWLMAFGAGIPARGELTSGQYYTCQVAPTVARLLQVPFAPQHSGTRPAIDF
ncbi:MAG: alkaline phosphatase family protein [Muribaculaceae bacterium]|nr:alkaline phosphatase family protein [Muribaculaceae bacterium]